MRCSWLPFLLLAAGCVGGGTLAPVEERSSDIIGGATDANDPSVVLLFMSVPGQTGGSLCTGELVSPHVVLTAAHCTGGEDPTITNATWSVFMGTTFRGPAASPMLPVKEAHFDTVFSIANPAAGHDIGVAILRDPVSATVATPLQMNRTPLDASYNGKPVRFVGYGLDNAAAQTGAGTKRQVSSTLGSVAALTLNFTDGVHETCNGDSGGPAFMTVNGQEVIVGLTSYGDPNCNMGGVDTRVDALAAFVDPYIQANDPSAALPPSVPPAATPPATPPAASGGDHSPSTPPVTTPPPSASGTGAVGASCVRDQDCASHLCGLGDHGNHLCVEANAASGGGGVVGGCTVAVGRGADAPSLALLLGAWLMIARRRRALGARR